MLIKAWKPANEAVRVLDAMPLHSLVPQAYFPCVKPGGEANLQTSTERDIQSQSCRLIGDTPPSSPQLKDYDSISRIDQWLTAILLHIKRSLTAEPDIN